MSDAILEFGQNKTVNISAGETTNISFFESGNYILSKQGTGAVINAGNLPLTYLKTVDGIEKTFNYTYKKVILTVTEQNKKYTVTQRIYALGIDNLSGVITETLQTTTTDSKGEEVAISPIVYKNLTQQQFDKLNEDSEIAIGLGENIVYERYLDDSDTSAKVTSSRNSNLFDFIEDESKKGSINVYDYFSIAQDGVSINGTSIKTLLEQTNGVGIMGDVNAINSLYIDNGTFLDETIYGGKVNDYLYATEGNDLFKIVIGSAVKGDTINDSSAGDGVVFGTLNNKGEFAAEQDIEKIIFTKLGDDLIISRPVDKKNTDKVTVAKYFESQTPSINVNGKTVNSETLLLTMEGNSKKTNTLIGSDYADKFIGGKKADKIITGKGNDIINTGKGGDEITINDEGVKTLNLSKADGNDTIIFSNSSASLDIEYNAGGGYTTQTTFLKDGNNLVLSRSYTKNNVTKNDGKVTVNNYFKENGEINVTNAISCGQTNITELISAQGLSIKGNAKKKNDLIGTSYKDNIVGGKKSDTITTGKGNDTITAGKGNDTITINGSGTKTVMLGKGEGNDTVVFSDAAAVLRLVYNSGVKNVLRNEYSYSKSENNLVITRSYVVKNKKGQELTKADGTITIKDYYKADGTINIPNNIYIDDSETPINVTSIEMPVTEGIYNSDIKTTTYTGTVSKDIFSYNGKNSVAFEDSNITDDIYNVTVTKGKSDLTVYDAGGNDIMNINNKTADMRIIFNVDKNGNVVKYTDEDKNNYYSLLLFNKNSVNYNDFKNASGMAEILDYFKDIPQASTSHYELGNGCIETINTTDTAGMNMDSWINYVAGQVAGWLSENNPDKTSMEILNSDDSMAVKSLLQVYTNAGYEYSQQV